jgi:hypothetical protein
MGLACAERNRSPDSVSLIVRFRFVSIKTDRNRVRKH